MSSNIDHFDPYDPYADEDLTIDTKMDEHRLSDSVLTGETSANFDDDQESQDDDDDDDDGDYGSQDDDEGSYDSYDDYGSKRDSNDEYDSDEGSYSDGEGEEYYYDEEYPEEEFYHDEEDEEERRKRTRLRRAWIICITLLCCLLILIILLIIFLLSRNKEPIVFKPSPRPTYSTFIEETDDDFFYDDDIILVPGVITTPMAPFNRDNCEITEGVSFVGEYRNVLDQCACGAEVTDLPPDVKDVRDLVIERVAPKFYGENFTVPWTSCEPANLAAIWLASGDNRDAGEPRQRYGAALTYYQLNGTVWDYMDGWMTPLNECLWMGIQCNNLNTMNSLALDTNNLFGPVR